MTAAESGDPRPDASCVAALIVTYHPDPAFFSRMEALIGQVKSIVIVDNGSSDEELAPVRRLVAVGDAELILNGENRGQATALNQGFAWARDRRIPWVITFDQDTTPGASLVAAAASVFDAPRSMPVAVVGAGWIVSPRHESTCNDPSGREVVWVVTSGALHSVEVWRATGQFRGDFFIDYVDIEYCLRARSAGYSIAQVCVTTMVHAYGEPTPRRILHKRVQPSNYSPARRYYNARNRLVVWRAYWRSETRFVATDVRAYAKEIIKLLLVEDQRRRKLRAIIRGVADAIQGVSGPLAPGRSRS